MEYTLDTYYEGYKLKRDSYSLSCFSHPKHGNIQNPCSSYCPHFNISGVESFTVVVSCGHKDLYFDISNPEILNGKEM